MPGTSGGMRVVLAHAGQPAVPLEWVMYPTLPAAVTDDIERANRHLGFARHFIAVHLPLFQSTS